METDKKSLIVNCPLCGEKSLHIVGEHEKMYQCISCGYVTAPKFRITGTKEKNKAFQELPEQMQKWTKVENNTIWIPTMLTLPSGMIYPKDDDKGNMQWAFARMVDISEDEQKDYPVEGQTGKFYTRRYDDSSPDIFENFYEILALVNAEYKKNNSTGVYQMC